MKIAGRKRGHKLRSESERGLSSPQQLSNASRFRPVLQTSWRSKWLRTGKSALRPQGGALIILVLICALMGTLMVSYLSMIQNQHLSVARAQAWNSAIVVAEAGIEEGMALLNSGLSSSG